MNTSAQALSGQSRLDTAAYVVLALTLFLAPIFFIPSLSVPFALGKSALPLYGTALAFVLWMVARLKDGAFEAPKSWFYASSGLVAIAYLVSALASGNSSVSLSGQAFELGTAAFVIASLVFFALIPLIIKSKERIFSGYLALVGSFIIVGLFHALRFMFGADFLSFGIFTSPSANLIGKWNDLSIFLGLVSISSLLALELATMSKAVKALSYVSFFGSLALLVVANFQPVWVVVALFSLVFFVYQLSFKKHGSEGKKLPALTLVSLVLSVFFIFAGANIGGLASNALGISQVEVRPSWGATAEISASSLSSDPAFGAGPNRFSTKWLLAKPDGINSTLFWNTDFNYGIGFIPSLLVTTGIVGALAMLVFLVLYLIAAIKALVREGSSPFSRYLVLSTLFGSLYLWIFSVIYVPSQALWVLTLGMTGLFVAALREDGILSTGRVSISERPAWSFVSVLVTILALIGTLSFAYFVSTKALANVYFQRGVAVLQSNGGTLDQGEANLMKALSLSESPIYYRVLSELYLARLNELFADQKISQTEAQSKFQSLLATSIQASQRAVALDGTDYQNYLSLGRVFEAVVPLNITGAYENAKSAYTEALARNPQSPEIELVLARLEVSHKDNASARAHVEKAIAEKQDYAEAIFLLSQIDIAEGNIAKAIESVRSVATLSPNDAGVFFQLGLLYYNERDYAAAVTALERAITLSPQYANAQYFLGLSYYQTGQKDKAISEFQNLAKSNPDNAEVKAILANLVAGKSPFTNQPDSRPEKRSTLPVKDSAKSDQ